ncbi:hypothetical protein pneo_cds_669 [Pandoravirus neocaledonia]|uniref:Uncharacterized protein n=1 Tax=Pandoravirus neocaledonia TaxID=2107708 RepID=A0A2U7UCW1_9VIRU|nr:hypothetical protein pneo_cds_669 [Pandoravirus neocaledonia]AVK76276.1 hypothetical protein pneo_cds_669 [Pandoravirus neocaledonia]
MRARTRLSRQSKQDTRRPEAIAQHFTHACALDALCALDAMARVAANDDTLDLWSACAGQVTRVLVTHVASNGLLAEAMAAYPEITPGSVVKARDAWYDEIMASAGGAALGRVLAVLDAIDELARDAVRTIGKPQARALERQAKAWAHTRRMRLFWANVDVATLRIDGTRVEPESIRHVYTAMRNDTFADVMAMPIKHHDAVILLCDIIMDLDSVLGSVDAIVALGAAVERTCAPLDCAIVGTTTE